MTGECHKYLKLSVGISGRTRKFVASKAAKTYEENE